MERNDERYKEKTVRKKLFPVEFQWFLSINNFKMENNLNQYMV